MKTAKLISTASLALCLSLLPATVAFSANEKAPAKKTDEAVKPYPLQTCIVTDNDLDSMGEESRMVYQGQEIKFCCKPCEKKFLKNPGKYLAKLTAETK